MPGSQANQILHRVPGERPRAGARRRLARSLLATAMAGGLLAAGCAPEDDGPPRAAGERQPRPGAAARGWVAETLARMTLEEKVGQLFVTYVYGETAGTTTPGDVSRNQDWLGVDNGRQAIEEYHLGGVIYFDWTDNLAGPAQVAGLSNGLQDAALAQPAAIPLLISTDQEHGTITRFGAPATRLPGSMALGASGSARDARTAARIAAAELRAVGITMNHAPVADVNVNAANPVIGTRSFSGDPGLAAELTAAQVRGYESGAAGVSTTAKHFPGHGDTDVDSHVGLPEITHSLAEWNRVDAPPFRAAIEAGADAIMTGHLRFPALDPSGAPATLSEPILTGLLREELGYDGVVITDSLGMQGVRQQYSDAEVPVRALQAGADLLLMPPDLRQAYRAVLDAVDDGELTEERIDTSVRRVLRLKEERGLVADPYADVARVDDVVGAPRHQRAVQELTDRTTTLVRNDDGLLPLAGDTREVLVAGTSRSTVSRLAERLDARGATATGHPTGADPGAAAVRRAAAEAARHDIAVLVTSDVRDHPRQAALVRALLRTGTPVVTIATGTPYDIASYPRAGTHLATYSTVPAALEAAARALFGETEPRGTLPVTVPAADDPDRTLFPLGHGLGY